MKKLLLIIFILTVLVFGYYKFWTSDINERRLRNNILSCLEHKQHSLEKSDIYHSTFKEAVKFYETQKDTLETFSQIKVIVERKFDKYIFYNSDSTQCLLMLLEKYPIDFHSGYIRIIQGKLNSTWKFKVGMHISFPNEDMKSLFPKEFKEGVKQYTFEMLSNRARVAVINHGDTKNNSCEIDEKWWFK